MKTNLVTILIFLVNPLVIFAHTNNESYYSHDQVDSIVAAEVKRQVDTLMINYKIEKVFNSKWESYVDRQNWFITKHNEEMSDRYTWIGLLFTLLAAGFGVVGPLITNKRFEKQIKDEFDSYKKQIEKDLSESKKSIDSSVSESKELIKKIIDEQIDKSKKEIDKHVKDVEKQLNDLKGLIQDTEEKMRRNNENLVDEITMIKEMIMPPENVDENASNEEKMIHNILSKAYYCCARKEYDKAFNLYLKAANKGDASAQFNIGKLYLYGHGIKQDYKKAFEWFKKAAEQGNAQAEFQLGEMYEFGRGVENDDNKAFYWYKRSAKQQYSNAQYYLGRVYSEGRIGISINLQKASEWFRKAAGNGNEVASLELKRLGEP